MDSMMNNIQSQMEQARNSHSLQGLDMLRKGAKEGDRKALEETAKQFESIFIHMMLKSMRAAEDVLADENSPFNSSQVKFYRDMHDQQLATNISSEGSIGLAEVLVQQLDPTGSGIVPASTLRSDGELGSRNFERSFTNFADRATDSESALSTDQKAPTLPAQPAKMAGFENADEFVKNLLPIAKEVAAEIGLDPRAMVAQAAVETGWGQHMIHNGNGQNSHNLFGVKASRGWQGEKTYINTLEYDGGVPKQTKAAFRSYESFADSMKDYIDFLKSSTRYEGALHQAGDPQEYFKELQSSGYATDPKYADKVMSVLKGDTLNNVASNIGI